MDNLQSHDNHVINLMIFWKSGPWLANLTFKGQVAPFYVTVFSTNWLHEMLLFQYLLIFYLLIYHNAVKIRLEVHIWIYF